MPLYPEHIQPMIDTWRNLANHYRHVGNHDAAHRTTRLADQLQQMTADGSIRYSPDPTLGETVHEVARECRTCKQIRPISSFGLNLITQTPGRQCRECQKQRTVNKSKGTRHET